MNLMLKKLNEQDSRVSRKHFLGLVSRISGGRTDVIGLGQYLHKGDNKYIEFRQSIRNIINNAVITEQIKLKITITSLNNNFLCKMMLISKMKTDCLYHVPFSFYLNFFIFKNFYFLLNFYWLINKI